MADNGNPSTSGEVLRLNGRSFYWAGQILSGAQLAEAAGLYHLCREIDDIADNAVTESQRARADTHLDRLNLALAGQKPVPETIERLYTQACDLLSDNPTARAALQQLITTARQDLNPVLVADHRELLRYCYGVAGTVGIMMCHVLKAQPEGPALVHAIDLGIAMQMTNIARDVLEDARMGRVYLPAAGKSGPLDPTALVKGHAESRHQAWLGVCELLGRAETYYASGWRGLHYLPFRPRLAIAVAAQVYREIGRQILRRGEKAYWHQRSVVSPTRKFQVSVAAIIQLMAAPRITDHCRHDSHLHDGLAGCPGVDQHPDKPWSGNRDEGSGRIC